MPKPVPGTSSTQTSQPIIAGDVWVTRTQPGAQRLAVALTAAGFRPWVAPVLEIAPVPVTESNLRHAVSPDYFAVMSEQAVQHAPEALLSAWRERGIPAFAVGSTTAASLAKLGIAAAYPQQESSEGLLQECFAALPLVGKTVVVLAGLRGRSVLVPALREFGSLVQDLGVYERVPAAASGSDVANMAATGAIVVSSGDGLDEVQRLWAGADGDPDVAIFTPSLRVMEKARGFGFRNAYNCEGADATAVCQALRQRLRPQPR